MILPELEIETALIDNFLSVVYGFRYLVKDLAHFFLGFKVKLIVRKAHAVFV